MSLDKAIAAGKERRQPFQKSARFDPACRVGHSCPWCYGNRKGRHDRVLDAREQEARADDAQS